LKHPRIFKVSICLISVGLAAYLTVFFGRYSGMNPPMWVSYTNQIIGLDICFIGIVTVCVAEFERKAKSLFVKAVVLLATGGLLYLLASWALEPPSSSMFAMNWSPFSYNPLRVPLMIVSLDEGLWALGFDFLYLGIGTTFITSLGMILVSTDMTLTSSGRAFKGWIQQIPHVDTQSSFDRRQTEDTRKSKNQTLSIMLFVLGLFLIAVGIALCTVPQTVTTYTSYFGVQIPSGQQTIYPAAGIGLVIVTVGIIVLIGAFIKTRI